MIQQSYARVKNTLRAQNPRTFPLRFAFIFGGCTLSTICYSVTIKAHIGLGPLFAFQTGIARHLHIALGTSVMVVGTAFVFLALCLRTKPGPGTLIQPYYSGALLDLITPHMPHLHGFFSTYLAVVIATVFMALGGALMFKGAIGVSSYTSIMLGFHRVSKVSIMPVRLGMETTMFVLGWLLGGVVGWGSVITGVLIGPSLHLWIKGLGGIPNAKTGSSTLDPQRSEVMVNNAPT